MYKTTPMPHGYVSKPLLRTSDIHTREKDYDDPRD